MLQRFLILLCLAIPVSLGAQVDALNISQTSHLPYVEELSDVWAYVDSTGNEWALVCAYDGLSIVNLANPANPVEAFFVPGANSSWRDVKTWGQYAYVSNETGNGLAIIDLGNLPNAINSKDTTVGGLAQIHNLWIDEFGYLYATGDNVNQGLTILDLNNDPWNPSVVGMYDTSYVHDVYIRNNLAYACEIYDGELTVLDVSDKSNIVTLGARSYPNGFTHHSWLDSSGTVCFTMDELNFGYLISWDVSNPSNIQELDRIRSSQGQGATTPHNVHYHNGFLVTSYYQDGIVVFDAHRPGNLIEVAHFNPNTAALPGAFIGMWGAYPYLPSGLILGTDIREGFYVLAPAYRRAAYLEGNCTDAVTTQPLTGVNIEILGTSVSELSQNSGDYATGIADSGAFVVRASKYGYLSQDSSFVLAPGVLTIWDPALQPAPVAGLTVRVEDAVSGNPIPGAAVQAIAQGTALDFTADASGQVQDPGFLQGTYQFVAGSWGHQTDSMTVSIDAQNNAVVLQLTRGYYDDFIFDFGWTHTHTSTTGWWERGEPIGTLISLIEANPETDLTDDLGDACYVTGNAGGGPYDDEVTNGDVILYSPVMDLSSYNNPWFIFDYWFVSAGNWGQNGFRDSLIIEIDNGNDRKVVWSRRDLIAPYWQRDTIRMTDFLSPSGTVQFIVRVEDNFLNHVVEAGFDKFRVEDQSTVANSPVLEQQAQLQVFPNPSSEAFSLRYDLGMTTTGQLRIFDAAGRVVHTTKVTEKSGRMQIGKALPAGIYFVALEANGTRLASTKILRH